MESSCWRVIVVDVRFSVIVKSSTKASEVPMFTILNLTGAVISFLNPNGHLTLFPVIFILAAILNYVNGYFRISQSGRNKKKKLSGILLVILGAALTALAVISAVSLWR